MTEGGKVSSEFGVPHAIRACPVSRVYIRQLVTSHHITLPSWQLPADQLWMDFLLSLAFPLYLPHDLAFTCFLGSACHVLPLAHSQVYWLCGGTHSDLFCFADVWAQPQVQLVTPSPRQAVGRKPVLGLGEKFVPESKYWCHMRKIFLAARASQRSDTLPGVVVIIIVTEGFQIYLCEDVVRMASVSRFLISRFLNNKDSLSPSGLQ